MSPKTASKSTASSSWWNERSKIMSMKSGTKTARPKSRQKPKTKKATKAETGQTYYCEVCGCEMVCASDSAGEVICCEEPMCVVI